MEEVFVFSNWEAIYIVNFIIYRYLKFCFDIHLWWSWHIPVVSDGGEGEEECDVLSWLSSNESCYGSLGQTNIYNNLHITARIIYWTQSCNFFLVRGDVINLVKQHDQLSYLPRIKSNCLLNENVRKCEIQLEVECFSQQFLKMFRVTEGWGISPWCNLGLWWQLPSLC